MNKTDQLTYYFELGKFIAQTILQGIYNPDIQLSNIGFQNGMLTFLDYAPIQIVSISEAHTKEFLQKFTESLFSILDVLPNKFTPKSYFRAGFTSYGGVLTHSIFSNAVNNGFSSFIYTGKKTIVSSYNAVHLYSNPNIAAAITEWKASPLDRMDLDHYPSLDSYSKSIERQCISPYNKYYLDNLYFINSYIGLKDTLSQQPILILNMALSAHHAGLTYTAYGLYQKCLSMKSDFTEVNAACYKGISKLNSISALDSHIIDYIKNCVCFDLFELLWILSDLDNTIVTIE